MPRFVVHERAVEGPATHVLVIGVGKYPHLLRGEAPCQNPDGMGQLSSPPISAREIAKWFITEYGDQGRPLGSLALLTSEREERPFVNPASGASFALDEANAANAEEAIRQWKARSDTHAANRLFFYFCGHGVSQGNDLALLMADFGADEENPLQGAIDFRRLMGGLKRCRATEQVFFLDACRSNSDVLIGNSDGYAGRVPLLPGRRAGDLPRQLAVPYYATLAGERAYARPNTVSLFTEALLKSLRGAAGDNSADEQVWCVPTSRLQEAVDHFMKQPVFAGEMAGVQVPVTGELPVFNIHYLTGTPQVPVYVTCEPPADNQVAEFVCLQEGTEKARRTLNQIDPEKPLLEWFLHLPYGEYEFRAEIAARAEARSTRATVRPVFRRVPLRLAR